MICLSDNIFYLILLFLILIYIDSYLSLINKKKFRLYILFIELIILAMIVILSIKEVL